ncbi:peroxiredoxin family protein [Desertibacillus haloalkaliphilus]|uniref:peroxiredoxin family protein n=1 Tax=Desertibacillus haloalkaliphilus TaxID=1328930 RepID=UPI001C2558B2|nr:peroxiredoxin family protein [Desertibacillus haloalkaliphilus]MBU8908349.1 peroxiredoxin family protein [Desertibacillus haloalkaliphilus]
MRSRVKKSMYKKIILAMTLMAFLAVISACNQDDATDFTLVNEYGEDVSLTDKERATVLFHFTEIG